MKEYSKVAVSNCEIWNLSFNNYERVNDIFLNNWFYFYSYNSLKLYIYILFVVRNYFKTNI